MDTKVLDYHEGIRITGLLIFHIPQFLVKRRDSDLKRFAGNNLFVAQTFKQKLLPLWIPFYLLILITFSLPVLINL